jgi:hypothetical protein
MSLVVGHSFAAGEPARAPRHWPEGTALALHSQSPTLVVAAHPRCACTWATVAELARLMTRLNGKLRAYVLVWLPEGAGASFERSSLFDRAARIDGVTVVADRGGAETERFGARTSGQVYLYGADGALRFEGGLTPSRAHEGDSVGRRRIVELVTADHADRPTSAVFGCSFGDEGPDSFWLSSLRRAWAWNR